MSGRGFLGQDLRDYFWINRIGVGDEGGAVARGDGSEGGSGLGAMEMKRMKWFECGGILTK